MLKAPLTRLAWRKDLREFVCLGRLGISRLLSRWWILPLIIVGGFVLILACGGADDRLLERIRQPKNAQATSLAQWFSYWGNVRWLVFLVAGLLLVKPPKWRRVCYACIIAVIVSTIAVSILRPLFGRARPSSHLEGFSGPVWSSRHHSFPSGHTTTAFAPAVAATVISPPVGVPCLVFAACVSWSRLQLNRHHPLDVLTGAALGTFIGLSCGRTVRGAKLRAPYRAALRIRLWP